MVHLVRVMSNVSTQFREELSTIIWSNVRLELDYSTELSSTHHLLSSFIADRPAVIEKIKSLALCIDLGDQFHDFNSDLEADTVTTELIAWCHRLSSHFEVKTLWIGLAISVDCAQKMITEPLPPLLPLKAIKVQQEVRFGFLINDDTGDDIDDKELEEKSKSKLTELLMPDSLRKTPSEQESYCRSRLSA